MNAALPVIATRQMWKCDGIAPPGAAVNVC